MRMDTLNRSPNSSLPPDDEAQRFADFFLQGSNNLRQYNAEFDDIGAADDQAQVISGPDAAPDMRREEQLAQMLGKKTAVGSRAIPRFGDGNAVNRPRKSTRIDAQMIL